MTANRGWEFSELNRMSRHEAVRADSVTLESPLPHQT